MTREERREYMRKRRSEHREEYAARMRKKRSEHREEQREYMKKYNAEHKEELREYRKKYKAEDLNSNGTPKKNIRVVSGRILDKCHTKLPGYEIHHCFRYEDPNKFIYIPKSLHLKIHQLLREKKIPADSDHWNVIRELVNSCEEYTYIRT